MRLVVTAEDREKYLQQSPFAHALSGGFSRHARTLPCRICAHVKSRHTPSQLTVTPCSPPSDLKYETAFQKVDSAGDGKIPAKIVKVLWGKSGIKPQVLAKIWKLADSDNDGKLDYAEFVVGMKLVTMCAKDEMTDLPESITVVMDSDASNPEPDTTPSHNTDDDDSDDDDMPPPEIPDEPVPEDEQSSPVESSAPPAVVEHVPQFDIDDIPLPDPEMVAKYSSLFDRFDPGCTRMVAAAKVKAILTKARIETAVLAQIWKLSDKEMKGGLNRERFVIAMHLTAACKEGRAAPDSLTSGFEDGIERLVAPHIPDAVSVGATIKPTDPPSGAPPAASVSPLPPPPSVEPPPPPESDTPSPTKVVDSELESEPGSQLRRTSSLAFADESGKPLAQTFGTYSQDEYDRSNEDLDLERNAIEAEIELEQSKARKEFDSEMADIRAEELAREAARTKAAEEAQSAAEAKAAEAARQQEAELGAQKKRLVHEQAEAAKREPDTEEETRASTEERAEKKPLNPPQVIAATTSVTSSATSVQTTVTTDPVTTASTFHLRSRERSAAAIAAAARMLQQAKTTQTRLDKVEEELLCRIDALRRDRREQQGRRTEVLTGLNRRREALTASPLKTTATESHVQSESAAAQSVVPSNGHGPRREEKDDDVYDGFGDTPTETTRSTPTLRVAASDTKLSEPTTPRSKSTGVGVDTSPMLQPDWVSPRSSRQLTLDKQRDESTSVTPKKTGPLSGDPSWRDQQQAEWKPESERVGVEEALTPLERARGKLFSPQDVVQPKPASRRPSFGVGGPKSSSSGAPVIKARVGQSDPKPVEPPREVAVVVEEPVPLKERLGAWESGKLGRSKSPPIESLIRRRTASQEDTTTTAAARAATAEKDSAPPPNNPSPVKTQVASVSDRLKQWERKANS